MGEIRHDPLHPLSIERGHEQTDVSIRPLAMFLGALTMALIITGALMAWMFDLFETAAARRDPERSPLAYAAPKTPGPLLQISPRQDMESLRAREEKLLHQTGWVNQDMRVVRIPIARAMALIVERGFPEWPAVGQNDASQAGGDDRTPFEPAERSPKGSGQTTPVGGGSSP